MKYKTLLNQLKQLEEKHTEADEEPLLIMIDYGYTEEYMKRRKEAILKRERENPSQGHGFILDDSQDDLGLGPREYKKQVRRSWQKW